MQDPIKSVVAAFYKKATADILIGYHFRKIAQNDANHLGHPLKPPIEAFEHHLPRIEHFWRSQLLGQKIPHKEAPFDLIGIHAALKIRKGELHRWLKIFRETLEEEIDADDKENQELKMSWLEKLKHFEAAFLKSPQLFS